MEHRDVAVPDARSALAMVDVKLDAYLVAADPVVVDLAADSVGLVIVATVAPNSEGDAVPSDP